MVNRAAGMRGRLTCARHHLAFGQNMGRNTMRLAALVLAASVAAAPALAQPLPAPASYPPVTGDKGVVTTHALSMEMADQHRPWRGGACRKMGFRTTITVLDASGALKAFLRDDGTGPHTISLSRTRPIPPSPCPTVSPPPAPSPPRAIPPWVRP